MATGIVRPGADSQLPCYESRIVLDSVGAKFGQRITTYEVCMPKWLVAEFNTHRMLSRNSASSRAVPTKALLDRIMNDPVIPTREIIEGEIRQDIEEVMTNPVIPVDFRSKNTGMVADIVLSDEEYERAKTLWLLARDRMVQVVYELMQIGEGIDKQRVNRLLEPWMKSIVVCTATEYENFFALRDNKEAQPEFGVIAANMHSLYQSHRPQKAMWHWPYIGTNDILPDMLVTSVYGLLSDVGLQGLDSYTTTFMLVSAARCGRVSYFRQGVAVSLQDDMERGLSFAHNKHWSPLEHPAHELGWQWHGNLFSWKPLRKYFPNESGMTKKVKRERSSLR